MDLGTCMTFGMGFEAILMTELGINSRFARFFSSRRQTLAKSCPKSSNIHFLFVAQNPKMVISDSKSSKVPNPNLRELTAARSSLVGDFSPSQVTLINSIPGWDA